MTVLSRVLALTCRFEFLGKEHEDRIVLGGGQIIFAGLHESMMLLPYHFRDRPGGLVMVSRSRDGVEPPQPQSSGRKATSAIGAARRILNPG